MTLPSRGEIWLVNFEPAVGAEIRKLRPAVVINLNSIGRLALRIVVPITDWKPSHATLPWLVELQPTSENGLHKASAADTFQMKSVSLSRFSRRIGMLTLSQTSTIAEAVAMCVGAP